MTSDPKNLIRDSFLIEGITQEECRSILIDWALSLTDPDPRPHLKILLARHGADNPGHPMTRLLEEGLLRPTPVGRRGGRGARKRPS